MEFPETGQQCSYKDCKQLDFLPITCSYCKLMYCKEHVQSSAHQCKDFKDNFVTEKTKTATYKCELCETRTPCEMLCVKCQKHFCLSHRHHGCFDPSEESKTRELKKHQQVKADFIQAKQVVEEEVVRNLKKTKNVAMANKVQFMRLKSRSVGLTRIPLSERRYFQVYAPLNFKGPDKSKGVFVSVDWTIGRALDYMSKSLKIEYSNNISTSKKLRIFDYESGCEIAEVMDAKLSDLLDSCALTDGQSVILEYSDENRIDTINYK